MRLAGKIAIVTGAASGFGEGIARKFVAEGARVVVADRDGDGARRVADALGAHAESVRADVTRAADVEAMVRTAIERFDGLDILVNNAGMGHLPQPLESLDEADFDRILAVNVKAIYLAAKEVVPRFKAQKRGVILNIASTAGVSPRPRLTWYNASKGWVITATRSMASAASTSSSTTPAWATCRSRSKGSARMTSTAFSRSTSSRSTSRRARSYRASRRRSAA